MEMLLRHTRIHDLARILEKDPDGSPVPFLLSAQSRRRARSLARKNGIWDRITTKLKPQDIPEIKRSVYRRFRRMGDRKKAEQAGNERMSMLDLAHTALWLDHPNAKLDILQDLLWAYCDDWTWVLAAHEGRHIDLRSSEVAAKLAEILHVMKGRLEREVVERVTTEIEKRVFDPYSDFRKSDGWNSGDNNWNHVCNGNIVCAALCLVQDPWACAKLVHIAVQRMTYAVDGFADDGGCLEGAGYWNYGWGHYVKAAHALYCRTRGEIDIMADPKIERICRFPLAVNVKGLQCAAFGDSGSSGVGTTIALKINVFHRIPELHSLCSRHDNGSLRLGDMHSLALYNKENVKRSIKPVDVLLPDLGQVKLRGKPGKHQVTLVTKAGNNAAPHNHNDIGSFVVFRGDQCLLTDPGAPVYAKRTFRRNTRYKIVFCNAMGHSVPVINGKLQPFGEKYHGTIETKGVNGKGAKSAIIDMSQAYPPTALKSLIRSFHLDARTDIVHMQDAFVFSRQPKSLVEAFITFQRSRAFCNGKKVRIGRGTDQLVLSSTNVPGTFRIRELHEARQDSRDGKPVYRITFTPEKLAREMVIKFEMK